MKISVVTISFNQAKFLRQCMDSVLNQNYPDIEYIVVDPGSTDGSREIIESYGDRIVKVFEKDSGPADGLNKGFSLATGDIYGFLNSDDILLPNAFKIVSKTFLSNSKFDAINGSGFIINEDGSIAYRIVSSKFTTSLYLLNAVTVFQQATFFKAKFFNKVGGFNIKNKTCWDGEFFFDIAEAGARFKNIYDDLAYFRLYPTSISGSGRLYTQYQKDHLRIYKEATGRDFNWFDKVFCIAMRPIKWILTPAYLYQRFLSVYSSSKRKLNNH